MQKLASHSLGTQASSAIFASANKSLVQLVNDEKLYQPGKVPQELQHTLFLLRADIVFVQKLKLD